MALFLIRLLSLSVPNGRLSALGSREVAVPAFIELTWVLVYRYLAMYVRWNSLVVVWNYSPSENWPSLNKQLLAWALPNVGHP